MRKFGCANTTCYYWTGRTVGAQGTGFRCWDVSGPVVTETNESTATAVTHTISVEITEKRAGEALSEIRDKMSSS